MAPSTILRPGGDEPTPYTARLAQLAGLLTAAWGVALIVVGWMEYPFHLLGGVRPATVVQILVNGAWVGFGLAVLWGQRFSTFLLCFVHLANAALMTVLGLLPERWSAGFDLWGWLLYVAVPALCAALLAPDLLRRWQKPLEEPAP